MVTQRGLVVFSAMCSAGMLWSAILIAGLLAGWRPVPTSMAVLVAALLTVPGAIAGVIANRLYYRTTRPRRQWSLVSWVPPHVPHWAAMLAGVLFFGFWLAVVVAFAGLDGNAQMRNGQYVLDDHGRITTVNQADYDRQLDHEQQISLGILGAIGVGGAFLTAALLTHEPGAHEPGGHEPGGHEPGGHEHGGHEPGGHEHGAHGPGAHEPGAHEHGAHEHGAHEHGAHEGSAGGALAEPSDATGL